MFSNEIEPIVNTTEKGGLKEGDVMMKRLNEAVMRINVIKWTSIHESIAEVNPLYKGIDWT